MRQVKTIKLSDYINNQYTALVGRDNGERLMNKLKKNKINLDSWEDKSEKIIIKIPKHIITINKSFFLGMFEIRIQKLGKADFKSKYEFEASDHIKDKINRYVDTALLTASMSQILDVK